MQLNNISYCDRHSRPIVLSKVGLQAFFLSDGQYTDPYQISSVTIFSKIGNLYPSSVLNATTQLVDTSNVSGSILMNFCNSSAYTSNVAFNPSAYTGGQTASGIYRTGVGKYIVILDGTINLSGTINLNNANTTIANCANKTGEYIDVWTLSMAEGSELQVAVNDFNLRKGGFTVMTQPLMLKTKTKLVNNKVTLGSKVDLKIATDVHVENSDVDESIKNLLRENVVTSGVIQIQKLNEATTVPARVTVSSYADTLSSVSLTSDNVMIFTWDTNKLQTHPELIAGNFGSIQGVYSIQAKYTVFNETIVSDPMYLTLS